MLPGNALWNYKLTIINCIWIYTQYNRVYTYMGYSGTSPLYVGTSATYLLYSHFTLK